jgi:hypothetical protein
MKTKLKLFIGVLALSVFFIACDKGHDNGPIADIDDPIAEESVDNPIEMGTASLKPSLKDVVKITTGKELDLATILEGSSEYLQPDFSAQIDLGLYPSLPELIELPIGRYQLNMTNWGSSVLPNFDEPSYASFWEDFEIVAGTNTVVSQVMHLYQIAVTIDFSESILEK